VIRPAVWRVEIPGERLRPAGCPRRPAEDVRRRRRDASTGTRERGGGRRLRCSCESFGGRARDLSLLCRHRAENLDGACARGAAVAATPSERVAVAQRLLHPKIPEHALRSHSVRVLVDVVGLRAGAHAEAVVGAGGDGGGENQIVLVSCPWKARRGGGRCGRTISRSRRRSYRRCSDEMSELSAESAWGARWGRVWATRMRGAPRGWRRGRGGRARSERREGDGGGEQPRAAGATTKWAANVGARRVGGGANRGGGPTGIRAGARWQGFTVSDCGAKHLPRVGRRVPRKARSVCRASPEATASPSPVSWLRAGSCRRAVSRR
jgi:hypothetical protein